VDLSSLFFAEGVATPKFIGTLIKKGFFSVLVAWRLDAIVVNLLALHDTVFGFIRSNTGRVWHQFDCLNGCAADRGQAQVILRYIIKGGLKQYQADLDNAVNNRADFNQRLQATGPA